MKTQSRKAAEVFPVGEFIRDELTERGMTMRRLAEAIPGRTDLNLLTFELLVNAPKKGAVLDYETAEGLALVFGTSRDYWINLDEAWQRS